MTTRYLPLDAVRLGTRLYHAHRVYALLGALLLWSGMTGLLRWRFRRWGLDVAVFSLVMTMTLLFISACLYLLATHPGYHLLVNL